MFFFLKIKIVGVNDFLFTLYHCVRVKVTVSQEFREAYVANIFVFLLASGLGLFHYFCPGKKEGFLMLWYGGVC